MVVEVIRCLTDNLCYLIGDGETNARVLIDASEAGAILHELAGRTLNAVFLTHHHHDHVGGLHQLPQTPLFCSERDARRVPAAGGGAIRPLCDNAVVTWHELTGTEKPISIRILNIPGHTEGQIALLAEDRAANERHLFVGDTLFSLGCGRCLEGTPEQLFYSLARIKQLPGDTRIYFGHEYSERNFAFLKKHQALLDGEPISTSWKDFAQPQPGKIRKAPRLTEELELNPFLQFADIATFTRWRQLRDQG